MGTRRRPPVGGWPNGIETVPMRDYADQAPRGARRDERVVEPPEPLPVRAWITQWQTGESEVSGVALAWTSRQVHVRFIDPHGREGWAWLWASAVTRR